MIKTTFNIWKKGWCVIGRLYLFIFVMFIITIPLRFIPQQTYWIFDDEGFHAEGLWIIGIALLITPFIVYAAARLSGEFMEPKRKKTEPVAPHLR